MGKRTGEWMKRATAITGDGEGRAGFKRGQTGQFPRGLHN